MAKILRDNIKIDSFGLYIPHSTTTLFVGGYLSMHTFCNYFSNVFFMSKNKRLLRVSYSDQVFLPGSGSKAKKCAGSTLKVILKKQIKIMTEDNFLMKIVMK